MDQVSQFTCIVYDSLDFLIPSSYIVAGLYENMPTDASSIIYNREMLPHIHMNRLLEQEFKCNQISENGIVIVLNMKDFISDVCNSIVDYTSTAFPASGKLALSLNAEIFSTGIDLSELKFFAGAMRTQMNECGINAVRFTKDNKRQFLISPDLLIRKFFAGALL